ncbi:hypothetical protein [Microbacterium sp. SS28]|uniref:hypothetical protein n=1 Tax=Microbacterium sp. SS28 TaxID=2919948 RepID=UPI001FAAAA50|nr:hypothetical protein [Microbacterium sp. SS28]
MTHAQLIRIVRASAVYDLVVTSLFALPFTARWLFDALAALHDQLGLPGTTPDSGDVYAVMFANLMGGLVVVWSILRLVRPSFAAGTADIGARVFFSIGMLSALAAGASPLVAVMLVLELAWALVQGAAVAVRARQRRAGALAGVAA